MDLGGRGRKTRKNPLVGHEITKSPAQSRQVNQHDEKTREAPLSPDVGGETLAKLSKKSVTTLYLAVKIQK